MERLLGREFVLILGFVVGGISKETRFFMIYQHHHHNDSQQQQKI